MCASPTEKCGVTAGAAGGNYDVAVVGGGIAGLVAARDVASAGLRVCVLERTDRLGGRVRAETLVGLPIELGAEAFATRGGAVETLLRELGLAESIVTPRAHPAWITTETEAYPLPMSGALGIPVHPLRAEARDILGVVGAVRLALEPWRRRSALPSGASLDEVVRERLGDRALEALVAPVVEGVYSASATTLRLDVHPELAREYARTGSLLRAARSARASNTAAGGAVRSLAGGMSLLVDRLIAALCTSGAEICLGVRQLTLTQRGDGVEKDWTARWAGGEVRATTVIVATPPAAVEIIGASRGSGETAAASETAFARDAAFTPATAVETVALVVEDARLDSAPRGTGALIRAGRGTHGAKALSHLTAKWAWLEEATAPGTHVLRLSYGSRGVAPVTAKLSGEQAALRALDDASKVFGVRLDPDRITAHARARWTIPARTTHPDHTAAPDRSSVPAHSPIVTGEAYSGTGLASVIPHARSAARRAISTASMKGTAS